MAALHRGGERLDGEHRFGFAIFLAAFLPLNAVLGAPRRSLLGQTFDWQFGRDRSWPSAPSWSSPSSTASRWPWAAASSRPSTLLKIAGIAFVVLGVFPFSGSADWSHLTAPAGTRGLERLRPRSGLAMLAALWAYDGWNNMPMAAGEVQNPGRNIPRALIGGMVVMMAIYCLANLAYFYASPFEES